MSVSPLPCRGHPDATIQNKVGSTTGSHANTGSDPSLWLWLAEDLPHFGARALLPVSVYFQQKIIIVKGVRAKSSETAPPPLSLSLSLYVYLPPLSLSLSLSRTLRRKRVEKATINAGGRQEIPGNHALANHHHTRTLLLLSAAPAPTSLCSISAASLALSSCSLSHSPSFSARFFAARAAGCLSMFRLLSGLGYLRKVYTVRLIERKTTSHQNRCMYGENLQKIYIYQN